VKQLQIKGGSGESTIYVGESLSHLTRYIDAKQTVLITDQNVWDTYKDQLPDCPVIRVGTGEAAKSLATVGYVYDQLMAYNVDRSSCIVGIGGGIVCDIAGFAASTYMRGVPFGFVSSTLLSQVDASVGGKNGVNHRGYKNMVGVFSQPRFVICDADLLLSLPKEELLNGFSEIVKHAAIASEPLLAYLEDAAEKAIDLEKNAIEKLICDSIRIKADVVNRDEKEQGERRKLNFGHTIGHAIEKVYGLSHGQAVSIGMMAAVTLSLQRTGLSQDQADRIAAILKRLGLPVHHPLDGVAIMEAIGKDKKRAGEAIGFVLLRDIGNAVVENLSLEDIGSAVGELFAS